MRINTKDLNYNRDTKVFATEISDLGADHFAHSYTVVSHRTGDEKEFTLLRVVRDTDNDIMVVEYVNDETGLKLFIFND